MKRYCLLAVYLLLANSAEAQLRVSPLAPAAVPAALPRSGRVVQALRYTDRTGTYTVLAPEIGPRPDPAAQSSDGQRADLYAYQYPATSPTPSWQVHDFADDCPLDLEARFLPKALTVTDLDQDGTAEAWLVYRTTCRGDVSPSTQKIIMKAHVSTPCAAPAASPSAAASTTAAPTPLMPPGRPLRQHAAQLWQQHRDERLSE